VTTGFLGGAALGSIPGSAVAYSFAGPQATVTLLAGQRIVAWGNIAVGLGAGGPQDFRFDVGYQPNAGGAITNAAGFNYMIGRATTTRTVFTSHAIINPGAGTWKIGCVIQNDGGALALNNNDWTNFTYMIVNQ
jgi:hypothetical protein